MEIAQWLGRSDACGTRGTTTYHRNAHRTTYIALNCDKKASLTVVKDVLK